MADVLLCTVTTDRRIGWPVAPAPAKEMQPLIGLQVPFFLLLDWLVSALFWKFLVAHSSVQLCVVPTVWKSLLKVAMFCSAKQIAMLFSVQAYSLFAVKAMSIIQVQKMRKMTTKLELSWLYWKRRACPSIEHPLSLLMQNALFPLLLKFGHYNSRVL